MNVYIKHTDNNSDSLSHYGVKGMKWRKRKTGLIPDAIKAQKHAALGYKTADAAEDVMWRMKYHNRGKTKFGDAASELSRVGYLVKNGNRKKAASGKALTKYLLKRKKKNKKPKMSKEYQQEVRYNSKKNKW